MAEITKLVIVQNPVRLLLIGGGNKPITMGAGKAIPAGSTIKNPATGETWMWPGGFGTEDSWILMPVEQAAQQVLEDILWNLEQIRQHQEEQTGRTFNELTG